MVARIHPIVWPTGYVAYLQVDESNARDHLAYPVNEPMGGRGREGSGTHGAGRYPCAGGRSTGLGAGRAAAGGDGARAGGWGGGGAANGNTARGLTLRFRHRNRSRSWGCWAATDGSWPRTSGPCVACSSGSRRNWSRPENWFRRPGRWSGWAARRWWRRCFSTPGRESSTRTSTATASSRTQSSTMMANGARWPTKRSTRGAGGSTRSTSRRLPRNWSALDTSSARRIRTTVSRLRAYPMR